VFDAGVASRTVVAADVNGITIEYDTVGDGQPLLLVMGVGGQLVAWSAQWLQRFVERGFRVIRFDNRDIGLSTTFDDIPVSRARLARAALSPRSTRAPYLVDDMADDAAGLLDHLGVGRAHVVGVSMGGMIGQALAIRHPERVASLTSVMSNTGDRRHGRPSPTLLGRLARASARTPGEAVEQSVVLFRLISGPHFDEAEVRAAVSQAFARRFDVAGTMRQTLAVLASPDRTRALAGVRAPTLVVHGLLDPLVRPSGGIATVRAVPGARLVMFPDMGHDMPRPRWDEIVEGIAANARRGGIDG
jgi:pimeloyl-ACP methyl ester carboxylesterase